MKKEKTVKTYQRRTKSGKMVTVKQHTAKYDAAEKAKEAAKKKGAGEEFDVRKNASQMDIDIDEFLSGVKARSKEEREKLKAEMEKQKSSEKKSTSKKAEPKAKETKSKDSKSCNASDCGFTAAEFKEWYQGTGSAADKKVSKALKAKLGRAGYKKLEDEAIDNYTSRGHLKMFKSLGEMKDESSKTSKLKGEPKTSKKSEAKVKTTKKEKSEPNKVKGTSKSKVSNKDFSTTSKQVSYVRSLIKELPEADRKELNSFARKASMGQITTNALWKKYTMKKYPKGSKLRGSYAPWDKRAVSDMRDMD